MPSKSSFLVVRAWLWSCFFVVLCSMSVSFADLSTLESVMNESYSFCAEASAADVSASSLAKSDSITSNMPTTPPFSACIPLYGESKISGICFFLQQGCRLASFSIKFFQYCQSLCNCSLSLLGILDGQLILCLLFLPNFGCFCHSGIEVRNGLAQFSNLFGELCNRSLQFINFSM